MFGIDDLIIWGIAPLLLGMGAKVAKGPPDDDGGAYYPVTNAPRAQPQGYAPPQHAPAPNYGHSQPDGVRIECDRNHQFVARITLAMPGKSAVANMLIDTGASDTHITHATAQRLGIQLNRLNFRGRVQTASGVERTAQIVIPEIHIQDTAGQMQITLYDVTASIMQRNCAKNELLGISALRQVSATLENDTLVLRA